MPPEKRYYTEEEFEQLLESPEFAEDPDLIDHPFQKGCCDQPESKHRRLTSDEFEKMCPKVFDQYWATADGTRYRLDARRYPDGIGVCVTQLFPKDPENPEEDDSAGLCWDFPIEAAYGLRTALRDLLEQTWKQRLKGD